MMTSTLRAILLPAIATMLLSWTVAGHAADAAGQFQVVVGEVRIFDANGQERVATRGGSVYEGDRIITSDGALGQIKFVDGGLMSVRANTEFVLNKFVYSGPQDEKPSILMSLVRGGLRSITGLIGQKNRDGYRIQTTTATIGIRGTDHEPMVILPPAVGGKAVDLPGTYDKVNDGRTFLQTPKGVVEILPRQVGFAGSLDVAPRVLPKVPEFYRGDPPKQGAATPAGKTGDTAADKSDPKGAAPNAATVKLVPGAAGAAARDATMLAPGNAINPAARDATMLAPGNALNPAARDATMLAPGNALNPAASSIISRDSAILSPAGAAVLIPDAGSIITRDAATLSPAATTLTPMTIQSPAAATLAPMTIQSPTVNTIAPMTIQSPTINTIAPMTIQSPTINTITPMTIQSPTTTPMMIQSPTPAAVAPATTTISPATTTISPLLAPIKLK
jgi:hypothetical protein